MGLHVLEALILAGLVGSASTRRTPAVDITTRHLCSSAPATCTFTDVCHVGDQEGFVYLTETGCACRRCRCVCAARLV
jgi:hypothetical protein